MNKKDKLIAIIRTLRVTLESNKIGGNSIIKYKKKGVYCSNFIITSFGNIVFIGTFNQCVEYITSNM